MSDGHTAAVLLDFEDGNFYSILIYNWNGYLLAYAIGPLQIGG